GWTKTPGSEAAGANGLEVSKDGKWLYVAAWGSQSFFRLSLGQNPPKRDTVPLGFRVDNIRWAPDGTIFASGQGATTSNVVKINPATLKVQEIIKQANTPESGSGTVAVQIGKEIWVARSAATALRSSLRRRNGWSDVTVKRHLTPDRSAAWLSAASREA